MNRFYLNFGFVILLATALVTSCSKSDSPSQRSNQLADALQTPAPLIASIHWLGKQQLAKESNATNFMAIWNMPESANLEAQTLDKLSTAPWRLWQTASPLSNAPTALLRPLLDDLVQAESYLEINAATNQPGELVLAIRLDATRAALWQTNLAAVLKSLFPDSALPEASGFRLQTSDFSLTLSRTGDWTLLALTSKPALKTQDSGLLATFRSRIEHDHAPFPTRATNYWLTAAMDLPRVNDAFSLGWQLPANAPQMNFRLIGDGENVQTRGELAFPEPLPIKLDPWRIPTNLIGNSLNSFTAVRGVTSFLASWPLYRDWQIGPPPNQLYVWSLPSLPMQTLLAVPLEVNDHRFTQVQQRLLTAGNQWLAANSIGNFVQTEGSPGVEWQGAPFMSPFVRPIQSATGGFLCMGLLPTPLTNMTGQLELGERVSARTNAVYYDWEFTGPRIESWFYMGQLFRVVFGRDQLPSDSIVTAWLKALQPKLSNSGTIVNYAEPSGLSLERNSTLGFTGFELHVFADWIESPEFPRGLHTTLVRMKRKLGSAPGGPPVSPPGR